MLEARHVIAGNIIMLDKKGGKVTEVESCKQDRANVHLRFADKVWCINKLQEVAVVGGRHVAVERPVMSPAQQRKMALSSSYGKVSNA